MHTTSTPRQGHRRSGLAPHRDDQGQSAIILVLGIVLIMTMGTTIFVTTTLQNFPVVQNNLAEHYAYRAVEAGLNEYEYVIETNPNLVLCNTTNLNTPQCQALQPFKFGQWNQVPYSGLGGSPTEWFSVYPTIDVADGLVKAVIDGAAQSTTGFAYQHESVSFQPTNSFLLHDWWSVHGIIDPVPAGDSTGSGACTVSAASEKDSSLSLLWGNGSNGANAYPSNCDGNANLAYSPPGTVFNGPVFSDDPMFVCSFGTTGSVNIGPASPWLGVTTAAPTAFTDQGPGCPGYPNLNYNSGATLLNQPQATPPDAVSATDKLASVAKVDGCLYSGPTSITFDGTNASGIGQYIVDSPETPLVTVSGVIEDNNNDLLKNTNACVPQTAGQPVQLPNNGVILVQTASSCTNALDATTTIVGSYWGSTSTPACEGNAIVGDETYNASGTSVGLSGSLTVAAANDVIIDNSITYNDCGTTAPGNNASSCQISGTANDILGLIASNYIDLNHPLSGSNNASTCGSGGGLGCDLSNPRIDAVVLALQHDFTVDNYQYGNSLGTIYDNGSMDQYFADIEGCSGCQGKTTGYINNYDWDQRLAIISPPYYLSPGTNAWSVASLNINAGSKSAYAPAGTP
jgi:hypothetical protein